jgi:hypothetical protein
VKARSKKEIKRKEHERIGTPDHGNLHSGLRGLGFPMPIFIHAAAMNSHAEQPAALACYNDPFTSSL